ncbi:ATP-grasp domain-containing protein [Brachyspira pilosicoli]|uniref:ATP-grasp domain-containing protein n=1 Tax=Brachyspira pilosicoli TaxID=52584 RepID=A0A5C8EAY1_BRAPL|nr:ATP-grasp domain-containing protein [Brachyspira pilosicoli]TXJ35229.1 ATP-grasp domain-containing protein [Brachyspira pilosicoli]
MKKILLLGGAYNQVYSIKTAKRLGYYTITCDYNPKNPGHKFADEYHEISTLDKEAVLQLAKKLKIDGIVCYAADTAAVTAAYVAEKMGLPGQPLKSVEILTNKDLFRKFLLDNGFNCPKAKGYTSININEAINDWDIFKKPVMVKPVDSAGSKGVSKVENKENLEEKIKYALSFSRNNRFIIEEYINLPQIEGDMFSVNGKLRFKCLANQYFYKQSVLAICYPYNINNIFKEQIDKDVQKIFNLLNMRTGAYNLEARYGNNNVFIMELGPRNGGNLIPETIKYATDIDMAEYTIKAAMNEYIEDLDFVETKGYFAYYNIHSKKNGKIKNIIMSDKLSKYKIELNILKKIGDYVNDFDNSSEYIGNVILRFNSNNEMHDIIQNMDKYIKVEITEQNRTEQNRTEQNRTEQNRTEQNSPNI